MHCYLTSLRTLWGTGTFRVIITHLPGWPGVALSLELAPACPPAQGQELVTTQTSVFQKNQP